MKAKFFSPLTWIKIFNLQDFTDNEQKAKIWGDKVFHKWINSLSIQHQRSIKKYTQYSRNYNYFLRKYYDVTTTKPDDMTENDWKEIYQPINFDIKQIDDALKTSQLTTKIIVYRRVDLNQFYPQSIIKNHQLKLRNNNQQLNLDLVEQIIEDFIKPQKGYLDPGFISTSLNQDPINDPSPSKVVFGWSPILLRILLPVGVHAAFIDRISHFPCQNEILIARSQLLQYKKAKIIIDRYGRQTLLIDVKLIKNLN